MTDTSYTLKQTVSLKMRTEGGDEVFISTGMEAHGIVPENIEPEKTKLDEFLSSWLEERASAVGASAFAGAVSDDAEEEEEEEEEEDGEAEEETEDLPTPDEIAKMKKPELVELITAHGLDVDESLKIKELREAVSEALYADPDEDGEEAEDEEAEEEEEAEDEEGGYTEAELNAMKLPELQEIAKQWEVPVKIPAGSDLKKKLALYRKAILAFQEAE